ncbi:MAG: sulfatase-like hydrolase/transferase [Bryobacterales bacterium]|nr:sulfatase-like hydrolase/transferase [Bryobacterales bacterium]
MTRRDLLRTTLAAPFLRLPLRGAARRTNVVMFMTDDHGAWALGAYGCGEMHTPNIDRLAAGGARFTRAYACTPVCSPSRLTYMTSKIPSQHGVQDWLRPADSFGERSRRWLEGHLTYSEVLARGGYTLGMCGKWHMGEDEKAQAGFTYWATVPGGGGPYRDPEFVTNGVRARLPGYKTDLVTGCALEFLETQRNSRAPFYLLVPFYAPHTPYDYQPEEYRRWYDGCRFSCYPTPPPHPWQNKGLRSHHGNRASMHAYSALISGVDHNVGRVLRKLEELGVREDTLVVFTADQGWNAGHHGVWGKGNGTWPFNMYEESLRVPLIWNHPGSIRAGAVIDAMVSSYDYFPAILEYLGITPPPGPARVGRSYAGFLRGAPPRWRNRLYFEYAHARAVRTGNLKYIQRTREWPSELYDLEADPGETANVIDSPQHARQLRALRDDLRRFFDRAGAPPLEDWRQTTRQELTAYGR